MLKKQRKQCLILPFEPQEAESRGAELVGVFLVRLQELVSDWSSKQMQNPAF